MKDARVYAEGPLSERERENAGVCVHLFMRVLVCLDTLYVHTHMHTHTTPVSVSGGPECMHFRIRRFELTNLTAVPRTPRRSFIITKVYLYGSKGCANVCVCEYVRLYISTMHA